MKRWLSRLVWRTRYPFGYRAAPRWREPMELGRVNGWPTPLVLGDWYRSMNGQYELGPRGWRKRAVPVES